jgi:hypothetical protein
VQAILPTAYLQVGVGYRDNNVKFHFGYVLTDNGKWHMAP